MLRESHFLGKESHLIRESQVGPPAVRGRRKYLIKSTFYLENNYLSLKNTLCITRVFSRASN